MTPPSLLELQINTTLREFPSRYANDYIPKAGRDPHNDLLQTLFTFLCNGNGEYLLLLFPHGPPRPGQPWSSSIAQGAVEGAEYTEAARGKPCGHILRSGEPSYRCRTCTADETCVLCSKCFDASDHEGHEVFITVSSGNAGCCDCGDAEAWLRPVHCTIHSPLPEESKAEGKSKEPSLPQDLLYSIKLTIACALDYFCDVFSCSPEQLRLPKTEESVREDERLSRLSPNEAPDEEYCLIAWNDEKHTKEDLSQAIARAVKMKISEARQYPKTNEAVGRVIVKRSNDLPQLLEIAKHIERLKVAATIRSARDTFREQMCATIIQWLSDIAGCTVGHDTRILRNTICAEMLEPWRVGSSARNREVAKDGIHDFEKEEQEHDLNEFYGAVRRRVGTVMLHRRRPANGANEDNDPEDEVGSDDDADEDEDQMEIDTADASEVQDQDMDDALEFAEATIAGIPPPPPPPAISASEGLEPPMKVPRAPKVHAKAAVVRTPKYWLEKPKGYGPQEGMPARENLWDRVRIDYMILYDLRMWKNIRCTMRNIFIGTVVNVPEFKRLLSLRFAGLYSSLAQLYLIADREPDCSIISLSLQMLTTPSITGEVIERGNFLTVLMAIIYTFVTTRQVGYPSEVNVNAVLAFEAGIAQNRRLHHFFMDMKCLLGSPQALQCIQREERYLQQFLDLVKLHQGIVPNTRALGDHVEYETDAWFHASTVTKEINRLCRQFSEAFAWNSDDELQRSCVSRAIRQTAKSVIINSLGSEQQRFNQSDPSELKGDVRFKILKPFEFDSALAPTSYHVVDFVVEKESMSFHHPLHYTLSWLIERGKNLSPGELWQLLQFTTQDLKLAPTPSRAKISDYQPEEHLLALFDIPLRTCAWLAQIKAHTWVRNGNTLLHQASTYRAVAQRDVTYRRDIFLLQTALTVCQPSATFLASMVDRYGLSNWVRGDYSVDPTIDESQAVAIAEDFVHLLIVLLCDRLSLVPVEEEPNANILTMKRAIAQVLCFKPMPHSSLTNSLTEKIRDAEEMDEVLEEMTKFRPPVGLNESGTYELKAEFIEEVDPYAAPYSRNQREEAESIYRSHISKKTGKAVEDVVFEPKLQKIQSGLFRDLAGFTSTPLFAQIIFYLLRYLLVMHNRSKEVSSTRIDEFFQSLLHLTLIAVLEDKSSEGNSSEGVPSFVANAISLRGGPGGTPPTILCELTALKEMSQFKSSEAKIRLILRRLNERRPRAFATSVAHFHLSVDRQDTASPAPAAAKDSDLKKKQALERNARVMAQMKEEQKAFLQKQEFDWGEEDFSDDDEDLETPGEDPQSVWKFPAGLCIHCRGDCNEYRLYGTFSYIEQSNILRQTPQNDPDYVAEAVNVPATLDCSADHIRPFGVAGLNKRTVEKKASDGTTVTTVQQGVGKGFPRNSAEWGPVAVSCGHIMHYSCFELYAQGLSRRHIQQTARQQPENLARKESSCPMCKAKSNAFLPIIWGPRQVSYPRVLQSSATFDDWLCYDLGNLLAESRRTELPRQDYMFHQYAESNLVSTIASEVRELARSTLPPIGQPASNHRSSQHLPGYIPPAAEATASAIADSRNGSGGGLQTSSTTELLKIYQGIRDTLKQFEDESSFTHAAPLPTYGEELTATDQLARTLGFSISATEISQRGVLAERFLLDTIQIQTLTHLKILSETVTTYISMGGVRNNSSNKTALEFSALQKEQLRQMFCGHEEISGGMVNNLDLRNMSPFLGQDPFLFLTDCAVFLAPGSGIDVYHLMRLCYLAEAVRVVVSYTWSPESRTLNLGAFDNVAANAESATKWICDEAQEENFVKFVGFLLECTTQQPLNLDVRSLVGSRFSECMRAAIAGYALPFLRKAAILMNVRFGVEFDLSDVLLDPIKSELQRLAEVLLLPNLNDLVSSVLAESDSGSMLRTLVKGWIGHWRWTQEGKHPARVEETIPNFAFKLSHPGIFELVGLPLNFATLAEAAVAKRCPGIGVDLTDPVMCMWCGDIFCGQANCCGSEDDDRTVKKVGGCGRHMRKCGKTIGMFINIRKGMCLFLHRQQGSWFNSPYLDKHGEVDQSLRRHFQLYLNQKRCDGFARQLWLNHGIPSQISRKLDQDMNTGGWETL